MSFEIIELKRGQSHSRILNLDRQRSKCELIVIKTIALMRQYFHKNFANSVKLRRLARFSRIRHRLQRHQQQHARGRGATHVYALLQSVCSRQHFGCIPTAAPCTPAPLWFTFRHHNRPLGEVYLTCKQEYSLSRGCIQTVAVSPTLQLR